MKKGLLSSLSLSFIVLLCLHSCKKNEEQQNASLQTSKVSGIKKGEPVLFTLAQVSDSGAAVNWSVTPSTSAQISNWGKSASVKFSQSGTYQITATYNKLVARTTVNVTDSSYNGGGTGGGTNTGASTLQFSAGEKIKITLSKDSSGSQQLNGLFFSAVTTNQYPCYMNSLQATDSTNATEVSLHYTGVFVPANCTLGFQQAGHSKFLSFSNGTTPLKIKVGNNVYNGTVTKTGNSFTVNWPNTTEVVISPTTL